LHLVFGIKWFLLLYNRDFIVLFSIIERFWSFWGYIGPFLRPDLGGEVGIWLPTLDIYKPRLIEAMKGRFRTCL
jgi:hypothetical protein